MPSRHAFFAVLLSSLSIGLLATVGCGGGLISSASSAAAIVLTGNWQFSSQASAASQLPTLSGELTGTNTAFTGILHANAASSCISPKTSFAVTGSADSHNQLTLTGTNVAGGTLTLTGTLAADGKSITNSSYIVNGGSCAFTKPAVATSQAYASISGTYTGNFTDADGDLIPVSATLNQTSSPDTNGNFNMTGTGMFPGNPCFSSPSAVTAAQVTGNAFTVLYEDPNTHAQINIAGTFSTDASTLSLTGWQLAGPCGSASGSGSLAHQ